MNFRNELAKWGYNKGNSIDVETLVNEILPELFKEKMFTETEVKEFAIFCADNHTLNDEHKDNILWRPIFRGHKEVTMQEMFDNFKNR